MAGKFNASLSFVTPQYVMITMKDLQFRFRKEEDKRRKIEIRIKKIRKKMIKQRSSQGKAKNEKKINHKQKQIRVTRP